jgi:hypothetical protein
MRFISLQKCTIKRKSWDVHNLGVKECYALIAIFAFIHLIHQWLFQPFVGPWPLLQFRNIFYTDGGTSWTSDQPVAKPATYTQGNTDRRNAHRNIHALNEIRAFERAKTVHALDRAASLIGLIAMCYILMFDTDKPTALSI